MYVSEEHVAFVLLILANAMAAGERSVTCCLCASQVERSRCTDIFGTEERKQGLPSRLSALLLLPIREDDRLISPFICRSCKLKFSTLEAKLEDFRAQV